MAINLMTRARHKVLTCVSYVRGGDSFGLMSLSSLDGFANQLDSVRSNLFLEFFKGMFGKGRALGFSKFRVNAFYNFIEVWLRFGWYVAHFVCSSED